MNVIPFSAPLGLIWVKLRKAEISENIHPDSLTKTLFVFSSATWLSDFENKMLSSWKESIKRQVKSTWQRNLVPSIRNEKHMAAQSPYGNGLISFPQSQDIEAWAAQRGFKEAKTCWWQQWSPASSSASMHRFFWEKYGNENHTRDAQSNLNGTNANLYRVFFPP